MPRLTQAEQDDKARLISEYKRLAGQADKRMQRLVKASQKPEYENILKWSYAKAQKDIKKWGGENKTRFKLSDKQLESLGRNSIRARLNDIKAFLRDETSTINTIYGENKEILNLGVKGLYKKRADLFNEQFDTNFTWQEYAEYHQRGIFEKFDKEFGYRTSQTAIGYIQRNRHDIEEALKGISDKLSKDDREKKIEEMVGSLHISNDAVVQDTISKMLSKYGIVGLENIV